MKNRCSLSHWWDMQDAKFVVIQTPWWDFEFALISDGLYLIYLPIALGNN